VLRGFFDRLVLRHVVILNLDASVRGERHSVLEGNTPEITIDHALALLASIRLGDVVVLRDRAAIAVLVYTVARIGVVSKLRIKVLQLDSSQWCLLFHEKSGKVREIPVRHDIEKNIVNYLQAAGLKNGPKDTALFRSADGKTKQLTANGMTAGDLGRMVKRRMKDAGLPTRLSPHSFRLTAITDLLTQGVPLEDVQHLAGHADPRTTRL
jgi:integrase/recombinase XerD